MKLLMCMVYTLCIALHHILVHLKMYLTCNRSLPPVQCSLRSCRNHAMMSGAWLTDEHISAAQRLLKNQFSHVGGSQSPLLAETNGFESVPSSGVQIHYCKHHWVTSSSIGEHVVVYDSILAS